MRVQAVWMSLPLPTRPTCARGEPQPAITTCSLNATGHSLDHLLPDIVPCGTVVGKLAFNWEGIPAGADVFVALGDLQCSVYPYLERRRQRDGDGDTGGYVAGTITCRAFSQ